MAREEFRVDLTADNEITDEAREAAAALDKIPDRVSSTIDVQAPGLDDLTDKVSALPGPLGDAADMMGQLGGAGAAGGVAALATGLFAAANASKDLALNAQTTADLTGSTVEEASKLQQLWGSTGADVNDLNDVLLQMNGALTQSPELAKSLGVNLNDGKNITQRFVEMTDKLAAGQLTAQQASQLFGEEGVRQVGKLRTVFGGLSDDLEGMPAPVDAEDVAKALEMEQAMIRLKTAAQAAVGVIGKDLVSLFGDIGTLADKAAAALPGGAKGGDVAGFLREWGTGLGLITKGADALTSALDGADIEATFVDWSTASEGYAESQRDAAEAALRGKLAIVDETAALNEQLGIIRDVATAQSEMADARRAAADSTFAARDAERDFAALLEETGTQLAEHPGMTRDNAAALDELAQGAGRAADAQVRLEADSMASMGATQSAEQAQKTWNASMLNSARTTTGPMQSAIIAYIAQVNGIPPEKVSEILANPHYDTIDAAAGALDTAAADRNSTVTMNAVIGNIPTAQQISNMIGTVPLKLQGVVTNIQTIVETVRLAGSRPP